MATLALAVVGQALGGQALATVGSIVGGLIDNVLFPGPKPPEPKVTASTYGNVIPEAWGPENRLGTNMIWSSGFRKHKFKTAKSFLKGVLGSSLAKQSEYVIDLAMAVANGSRRSLEPSWCRKLWANGTVIFDAADAVSEPTPDSNGVVTWDLSHKAHAMFDTLTVYPGNFSQLPDPTIEAKEGVGEVPAYRGTAYFVMTMLKTTTFGNGVPVINCLTRADEEITLGAICLDIAEQCGIDPLSVSTSSLTHAVRGYAISGQADGVSALQPLALCYDFDVAEVAGNLRFIPRGQPALCAIVNDQLAGHPYGDEQPDAFDWPRDPEYQLPKIAAISFNDPARDYNQNTQSAKRLFGSANSNISASVQLTLTSDEGRKIADRMLWEAQVGRQTLTTTVDDRLWFLESGRNYSFETPLGQETVRIVDRRRGTNGVIEITGKRDHSSLYFSTAPGASAPSTPNPLLIGGPVNPPIFVEAPSNFPGVTQATLMIGLSGGDGTTASASWAGASIYASTDDSDYVFVGSVGAAACMGKLTAPLAAHGGGNPDATHTLSVTTAMSAQDVPSISTADAARASIPYYVGGEFISVETSTDLGAYAFDLTNLWRHLYGSSGDAHIAGESFLRLDEAVFRFAVPAEYIGETIYFRFVGSGETLTSVATYAYNPSGAGYGTGAGGTPGAPTISGVTAAPGGNVVQISGLTPDDNVTDYVVYRADGLSAPFAAAVQLGLVGGGSSGATYTDTTASVGAEYTYFAGARNVIGEGDPSAGEDATTSSSTPGQYGAVFSKGDISTAPLSTVIGRFPSGIDWSLPATTDTPAGYVDGKVDVAPSAQTDFDLLRDGVSIGTVRFALGSTTPTLIKAAASAFVGTDYLDLKTPANLNGMRGAFGVIVVGQKT
jgi:hypothetical protein